MLKYPSHITSFDDRISLLNAYLLRFLIGIGSQAPESCLILPPLFILSVDSVLQHPVIHQFTDNMHVSIISGSRYQKHAAYRPFNLDRFFCNMQHARPSVSLPPPHSVHTYPLNLAYRIPPSKKPPRHTKQIRKLNHSISQSLLRV